MRRETNVIGFTKRTWWIMTMIKTLKIPSKASIGCISSFRVRSE